LKKLIAILFLSIYLISTTELHQLGKLPLLMEHYKEHKQENSNLTFFDFLNIHYSGESSAANQHNKHEQLPFKSNDGCVASLISVYISPTISPFVLKEFGEPKKVFHSTKDILLSSTYLSNIWQPPKTC
jgi:hypothetical protein